MRLFGYPYNDLVMCKDSPDYLGKHYTLPASLCASNQEPLEHSLERTYVVYEQEASSVWQSLWTTHMILAGVLDQCLTH